MRRIAEEGASGDRGRADDVSAGAGQGGRDVVDVERAGQRSQAGDVAEIAGGARVRDDAVGDVRGKDDLRADDRVGISPRQVTAGRAGRRDVAQVRGVAEESAAVTEAALTTFPLAPVRVAATLLMLSALVSVPRPVMLPKLPAAIWALVMTPLAMWVARITCEPMMGLG